MRIVAPWYSPVLPNGVVDEKCAVEKALDFGGVKTGNRRLATVALLDCCAHGKNERKNCPSCS